MSLRTLIGRYLGPYRSLLWLVVVLQGVQTLATMTLPALNANLIDRGVLAGDDGRILRTGAVMLAVAFTQILFAIAAVWFGTRVAMGFGRDVRRDLFHTVTAFSTREVGQFGAPSLITRITNDVQQVQQLVVLATTLMVAAPLTMGIGIVMAVREDVGLSVVLVVAIPVAVAVLGAIVVRMVPAFQAMQERIDRVNGVLREQITGLRVIRAFVREPNERVRFAAANASLTEASLRAGRLMAFIFPTVALIVNASSIGVLWIGADRIDTGQMQVGSLVAYLTYLIQILMAVVMATFMLSMIPRASVAAERIVEVLDTESSVVPPADPVRQVDEHGTLELRAVSFRYPGAEQPVVRDVSLRAAPGSVTAIIGSTGAGKTTLVNLVPRLVDATEGQVLVNGVDVRALDPELLWRAVACVPQRTYLFSGTIASNLRFGRRDATDDELWDALDIAQAAGFVRSLPDGLDAEVAQGGSNFSGGQRQRLAIARALVARPEIYVFDDSFSALDLSTDARVRAALAERMSGATIVMVAQRVSTIQDADQILVLEDGRVVGLGRHDDLLHTCPTYAEIVESQLGEGAVA